MILALAVALGLIGGLARYRSRILEHIAAIPLRSAWLAILALILQWPLLHAQSGPVQSVRVQQVLFLLSHVLLLVFVWLNRRLISIQIVGLGVICNLLVIAANGGLMPITPETLTRINSGTTLDQWQADVHYAYSKDIILRRDGTRLWALADIFVIPPPFPQPVAFSVGDLLIGFGIVRLLLGSSARLESAKSGDP
jgi:hypothetical protein